MLSSRSLFPLLFWMPLAAAAQSVFVPDVQLRDYLNDLEPGVVDASGYIDPTSTAAIATEELALVPWWSPVDLTGIEALENLHRLTITREDLEPWIPDTFRLAATAWPPNLLHLEVSRYIATTLPALPSGLEHLRIDDVAQLGSSPDLPVGLDTLALVACPDLAVLPALPDGLTYLQLDALPSGAVPPLAPAAWPTALRTLWFSGGGVDMPLPLPEGVTELHLWKCAINGPLTFPPALVTADLQQIDGDLSIPALPPTLGSLNVTFVDSLDTLPELPSSLRSLALARLPSLHEVPALPEGTTELLVDGLSVTQLPELPSSLLALMIVHLSELHCLPLLPEGLGQLSIDEVSSPGFEDTPISCLPNIPPGMGFVYWGSGLETPTSPSMLCTVLNSTCEFVNPVATGTVYWDQNANGSKDDGEPGYPFATVNVQPGDYTYGVAGDGTYATPMPVGSYTLTCAGTSPYVQNISPATHIAELTGATDVDADNDFGVVLQPNVQDLRINASAGAARPGFDNVVDLTYANVGSLVMNGTVSFAFDGTQSWVGSTPAPTTIGGMTAIWDFSSFAVGASSSIIITLHTDASTGLGTSLTHTAEVGPTGSDATPGDNAEVITDVVVGSIDPNDKRVSPEMLTPDEVVDGTELLYTIRFQNTGTYPAGRVLVIDTLDALLDASSFRWISASHPCTWVLVGHVLRFTFDPIQLPDSTSDEPGSHGYICFAIRTQPLLGDGTLIPNSAAIHFDQNAPVITVPAVFRVDVATGVRAEAGGALRLWPNPATTTITIAGTTGTGMAEVLDAVGRTVARAPFRAGIAEVDVHALPAGLYSVRLTTAEGTRVLPFIQQ